MPLISRRTASPSTSRVLVGRVVPDEVEQRLVHLVGGARQLPPDPLPELVVEVQVAARVARRVDGLVPPLQHPLGLREGAGLLDVRGRGQEEHLGADVGRSQLAGLDLGPVLPEGGGLDHLQVPHHQPVQVGHAQALHLAVGRADRGVLADQEVALAAALDLRLDGVVRRVVAGDPWQVVEAEVVVGGGRVSPVGLQQAHRVGPHVAPEPGLALVGLDVGVEVLVELGVRHRDVARQDVEQRRDVGGPLDAGVSAQRHDPAAGATDVAQQHLQDRRGADVLHADAVVGPAHRVAERAGALASAVARERVGYPRELLGRDAADLLHHLRGVAREVPLEDLEDAVRVLQGLVAEALPADRRATGAVALRARDLRADSLWDATRDAVVLVPVRVPPGLRVVVPGCRGRSRRTGRRGPRCPGSSSSTIVAALV